MTQTVFVGLSGGVDSGTSAALLKEQGYEVVGVFIKIWQPEFIECTWREDRLDAMRVAAALAIPFREIDLSNEYKHEVVETMVRDYERGVTPNPDVLCNEKIKFGAFAQWAFENGADLIATGHYARAKIVGGKARLLCGVSPAKDQSYFLYRIGQNELARTLFPIGEYEKTYVRELAARFDLPVANKHDSQGLCFVGDVSMADFLRRFIKVNVGIVVDTSSKQIGTHDGAALYTIGERHGMQINGKDAQKGAWYVVAIDTKNNVITASTNRTDAARTSAVLDVAHWIADAPTYDKKYMAQARYHEKPFAVTLQKNADGIVAQFDTPHIASAGQSLVIYDEDECLGGGIIK